jgi:polyphosphate:AMP phosphotransferase
VFEAAELGSSVSKEEYDRRTPALRLELINAQYDLRRADFAVVVEIAGDDLFACNEVINILNEWMDARYIATHVYEPPSSDELERPRFWRYWRVLPRKGQLAIFASAWTFQTIVDRTTDRIGEAALDRRITHVNQFEQTLADNGALLIKVWLHLPKAELRKRLKKAKKDPDWEWRVDPRDAQFYQSYDDAVLIAQRTLRQTSTATAPWNVVESTDAHYRNLMVGNLLLAALTERLEHDNQQGAPSPGSVQAVETTPGAARVLASVDLGRSLEYEAYDRKLAKYQRRLALLSRQARRRGLTTVIVFEGWDAAGKGGVIRRLSRAMDARHYRLIPISAPTEEEKAHHYLWRFWQHLPRAGKMLIFDRSWYGRVLVERVEGYATDDEWKRAYSEINDFEDQLLEHGIALFKFWLQIDEHEQLERFRAREKTGYKKYKITDDDYRNRQKRPQYEIAVEEMIARTSTEVLPWHLVPANDKRFARIAVIKTVCRGIKKALR